MNPLKRLCRHLFVKGPTDMEIKAQRIVFEQRSLARQAAQKVRLERDELATGTSQDPAANRYFIREYESDRIIAEANARDWKKVVDYERNRWF